MTASTNLGKVAMIPKGIWNAQSAYSKLNVVTIGGSSYLAVQDVPVGTSVSDTTYWQLLAEKGTSGGVGQLADEFSANNSYAVGDYCSYNQDVYRFISPHSGAWDVADVVLVSIANELKGKITQAEATALIESSTVAEAEKLETARTIAVSLESNTSASFDGSEDITPGVTGTLPIANGGTGNTEGKASALATPRTIQTNLESTNSSEFDGSANVTPGVTGILAKANGGTGNANGTADKLTTARTIRTNLGSTSTASFDGSANVTPGITGTLGTANGGTGNTNGTVAKLTNARTFRTNLGSTSTASFDGSANVTPGVTGTLPIANGGTGATAVTGGTGAVHNLFPNKLDSSSEYIATFTKSWANTGYASLPLAIALGGTGASDALNAAEKLGVPNGTASALVNNADTELSNFFKTRVNTSYNTGLNSAVNPATNYMYILQFYYSSEVGDRTATSPRIQIALPAGASDKKIAFRTYWTSAWSAWHVLAAT